MFSNKPNASIDEVMLKVKGYINNQPLLTFAMIGLTGVGKSSTINSLFNAGQPINHVRACTPKEAPVETNLAEFYPGSKGNVIVYDMPGLGQDLHSEEKHMETYLKILPNVDVSIWTIQTGNREMLSMQRALQELSKQLGDEWQKKLMFAINKIDLAFPGESGWNTNYNQPNRVQKEHIEENEIYVAKHIADALPNWKCSIVSYSATKRFNLHELIDAMMNTTDKKRRWLYSGVDIAPEEELISPDRLAYINSLINK